MVGTAEVKFAYNHSDLSPGPNPHTCKGWEPKLKVIIGTNEGTRYATVASGIFHAADGYSDSAPQVSGFICDWTMYVPVPAGKEYTIFVIYPNHTPRRIDADSTEWAFRADTVDPAVSSGERIY